MALCRASCMKLRFSDSESSCYELLGYETLFSFGWVPTFWTNILLPSSGKNIRAS